MPFQNHRGAGDSLESNGWGKDWDDFWKNNRRATPEQVIEQLEKMKGMEKYSKHLSCGCKAKKSYPWRKLRDLRRKTKRGTKGAKALAIFFGALEVGNTALASCGECDDELAALQAAVEHYEHYENVENCQEMVDRLKDVFDCGGMEEAAGLTQNVLYAELCSVKISKD